MGFWLDYLGFNNRWGPIASRESETGIIDLDSEGHFPHTTAELQSYANPDAVALEIKAQVSQAIQAGIDRTYGTRVFILSAGN